AVSPSAEPPAAGPCRIYRPVWAGPAWRDTPRQAARKDLPEPACQLSLADVYSATSNRERVWAGGVDSGETAKGRQPAGPRSPVPAVRWTADAPVRDRYGAQAHRQGHRHEHQVGLALHGGRQPREERLHPGDDERARRTAPGADGLQDHRGGPCR